MISVDNKVWKPIEGFENYEINCKGEIKSLFFKKNKILKPYIGDRYLAVNLYKEGKLFNRRVHRLVAETFITKPEGKFQVNHKNGNKLDNRVENLEWCTSSENIQHAYNVGLKEVTRKVNRESFKNKSPEFKASHRLAISKVVTWIHPLYGEFFLSAKELISKFPDQKLKSSNLSSVSLGKRDHHKQWRIGK